MIVDRQTRRLAMLRIYRAVRGVGSATLHDEDLEREWRTTGLRRADLDAALREMAQRRLILVRTEGPHRNYELTNLGLEEFHNARDAVLFHFQNMVTLMHAQLRRWWARLMPPPGRPAFERRAAVREELIPRR